MKEDGDDFLHKLDMAIGSDTKPIKISEPTISTIDALEPTKTTKNGLNGLNENKVFMPKDEPKDSLHEVENSDNLCSDFDAEKLENELLKGLEDENNDDDLFAVSKEVEDLLDSVIDSVEKVKEPLSDHEDDLLESSSDEKVKENVEESETNEQPVGDVAETSPKADCKQEKDDASEKKASDEAVPAEETGEKTVEEDEMAPTENDPNIKAEDLLIACASPQRTVSTEDQVSSEVSSNSGDGPTMEDSSDGEKSAAKANGTSASSVNMSYLEPEDNVKEETPADVPLVETESDEAKMEEKETSSSFDKEDELHLCIVQENIDVTSGAEPSKTATEETSVNGSDTQTLKGKAPFKMRFMRKFSSAVGELSRPELEELLIQKITESMMFCSETTELRGNLKKLEESFESLKKRFESVQKQYFDLDMIHTRVMKDLRDRPDAPITPVKITRAVGLQVYQPIQKSRHASTTITLAKPSNKRPMEQCLNSNGLQHTSPENVKRKKTLKTTPMRPPLSEQVRVSVEMQEAKEQQSLRTNVSKSLSTTSFKTGIPANVTITMNSGSSNGSKKSSGGSDNAQVIDLSDDESEVTGTPVAKVAPLPPALVAIQKQQAIRSVLRKNSPASRLAQFRGKFVHILATN